MSGKVLVACPVLVLLTASAWAGTITDPSAGVEAGGFSNPISGVTSFNPAGDPGHPGEIGLYNDTGALITGLSLSTTISTGLDSTTVANDFNCNDANTALFPNPFFLHCGIAYDGSSGKLTISFFGVNPSDGDETNGTEDEVGEQEGIPTIAPRCIGTPDGEGCTDIGHFILVFNDNFVVPTPGNTNPVLTNGWTDPNNVGSVGSGKIFNQAPSFGAADLWLLLAGGALALAILKRRRSFSRNIGS
ncbi:exported hypothetical protein [Candidatus Sulfopaludibacter sp. SbA3]|nr:exported hypothetical protein [Candidatus Sulfopaludibacter sp. SbA3]